jgi:hypothetical protein
MVLYFEAKPEIKLPWTEGAPDAGADKRGVAQKGL